MADFSATIPHGGRLRAAAAAYGIPPGDWLDLSTGISPSPWPVPPLPADAWARLPEPEDDLAAAARDYYGASGEVVPVAGSQAAIQALPLLRPRGRVGVLAPGYGEHAHAWRRTGHAVAALAADAVEAALPSLDVLVLINPNNPTGTRFARDDLLRWRAQLAARGGWLVVDEAFMDATPGESLAGHSHLPGLVLLRSLGKFFGLAGARVGFALCGPELAAPLAGLLGPWTVAGPSRAVAAQALRDHPWQAAARAALPARTARLDELLCRHGLAPAGGTALFRYVPTPHAAAVYERLARQGILVRRFDDPPALRLGLPGNEAEWARLAPALAAAKLGSDSNFAAPARPASSPDSKLAGKFESDPNSPKNSSLTPIRGLGVVVALGLLALALPLPARTAPVTVADDLGRTITLAAPARRIVSLAPHATELLFSAGAGDRVVGAVDYSDFPPAARAIPRVGSYTAPDLEAILGLAPDLVVGWYSGNGPPLLERVERLGLPVYASELRRPDDVAAAIERLGTLAGTVATANATARTFRERLAALRTRYGGRPPVRVFYQVWHRPLMTVNGEHLISRLIETCGGRNVFADLPELAPAIDLEAVLAADPQAIVASGMDEARPEWLDEWRRWPQLDAVRHERLYFVPPDLVQRATARVLDGAARICEALEHARGAP